MEKKKKKKKRRRRRRWRNGTYLYVISYSDEIWDMFTVQLISYQV